MNNEVSIQEKAKRANNEKANNETAISKRRMKEYEKRGPIVTPTVELRME